MASKPIIGREGGLWFLPFVCDVLQVPSHDDGGVSLLFSRRFFVFLEAVTKKHTPDTTK
jgi:hypothetical protein